MKKILCFVLAAFMMLTLAACSDNTKSVTMIYEQEGIVIKYMLDATGDVVEKITQTSSVDCSDFTEDQISTLKAATVTYEDKYSAMEGVEYSIEENGDFITEKIVIDATNADLLSELSESGLLPIEGETSSVSLSKTVERLEEQGWSQE